MTLDGVYLWSPRKRQAEGDLPKGLVPEDLARFIFTLIAGMAAQVLRVWSA